MLNKKDIQRQSESAYKQWCVQWREQARINSKWPMKSLLPFRNSGVGKAILCVANGYSLEEQMPVIKEHWKKVDIICCDKSLKHLIDNGINPTYCMVCDANVPVDPYLTGIDDQLQDTILVANVCANPKWIEKGNWKDRYFYCVEDVLKSEKEFTKISGCPNTIPAGTNVSNAVVIFLAQANNDLRQNFFGYDKMLLIGFDYSWPMDSYYAFDKMGGGKYNYMRHAYLTDFVGRRVFSSGNLLFSARWLSQYIETFKLPVVQCSKRSILGTKKLGELDKQMQYSFRETDREKVNSLTELMALTIKQKQNLKKQMSDIALDHYHAYQSSIV